MHVPNAFVIVAAVCITLNDGSDSESVRCRLAPFISVVMKSVSEQRG